MANPQPPDIEAAFARVLKRRRLLASVSQEELAFRANVDRTFISRLERGTRQPTLTTLIGIGAALNIPASTLVEETEAELAIKPLT